MVFLVSVRHVLSMAGVGEFVCGAFAHACMCEYVFLHMRVCVCERVCSVCNVCVRMCV